MNKLDDLMELKELKDLVKGTAGSHKLSARALNILWVHFSNERNSGCLPVNAKSIALFVEWVEFGYLKDDG